jgi:hypothetical protein
MVLLLPVYIFAGIKAINKESTETEQTECLTNEELRLLNIEDRLKALESR